MVKTCFYLLFSFCFTTSVFSQVELTAVPFLEIRPDAHTTSNGGVFAAMESSDVNAFVYNPAQLGNFGKYNNLSFQTDPGKTVWLRNFGSANLTLLNTSLAAGYSFDKVPISFGIAYSNHQLDLGSLYNSTTQETYSAEENYDMYAFGIRYNFGIRFNVGFSYKDIFSDLGEYEAQLDAFDFGFQAGYPFNFDVLSGEISLGYALLNSGDYVQYNVQTQPDPIPKKSVLGYNLSLGYQIRYKNQLIDVAGLDWSVESEDILVKWDGVRARYMDKLNILPLVDNMLTTKSNNETLVKHGLRLHMMESVTMSFGKFYGPGFPKPIQTTGVTLDLQSLSKFFLSSSNNGALELLKNHFNVSYSWATYHSDDQSHPLNNTSLNRIAFTINGF